MTRKKRTVPTQETYLLERRPEFQLAEANNTRKQFFHKIYPEWLARWPNREPTQEEIQAATSREQAKKFIYDSQLERLQSWYRNKKRGPVEKVKSEDLSQTSTTSSFLKLKQKRKQQAWQAYHSLTYESQWKPVIDEQWAAHVKDWQQSHPNEKMAETRFAFMNNFIKEKFKNETDEVKKAVEEHRTKANNVEVTSINKIYQENIPKLPRTLINMAVNIEKQAGWFTTFITGGPTPGDGGEINTYIYHHGCTPDGQNFEAFVGKEKFDKTITDIWDDFLQEGFPADIRAERALKDEDLSDSEDDGKEGENGNEEKKDDVKGKKKENVNTKAEISDYERTKQQNIARNKDLLEQMGLAEGSSKLLTGEKKKKRAKKDSSATTTTEAVEKCTSPRNKSTAGDSSSSGQTGNVGSTVVVASSDEGGGKDVTGAGVIHEGPTDSEHGQSYLNTGEGPDNNAQGDADGKDGNQMDAQKAFEVTGHKGGIREEVAADATLTDVNDTTTSSRDQGMEQGHTPHPGRESNEENAMDITERAHSPPRKDNEVVPMPGIDPQPDLDTAEKSDHAPIDPVDPVNPDISIGSTSTALQDSTDSTTGSTSTSYSLKLDMEDAPSFLSIDVVKYLRQGSDHHSWQQLVNAYLAFEKKATSFGKLLTTDRPRDIAAWIKRHVHKKHLPVEVEPKVFGPQFLAWWKAMQPPWRLLPGGGFSKESSPEEGWAPIHKGGSAGLYIVVMALSWWVFSPGNADAEAMWDAVDDFAWVLKQLQAFHTASKRTNTSIEDVRVYKRSRKS